uniref:Secreted protein n=1 Tax=Macrostomum lignano TaxID=282301 RepID=A0A1I8HU57_9PLAT
MDNAFVLQLCLAIALFQLPVCSAVTKCIVGAFSGTNYSTAAFDALKSAKSKTCPTTSNDKCHTVYTSASGQLTDAKVYIGCESDCTAKETAATPANVVKGCTSCKGYDCAPTTAPAVTTPNKNDVKDSKDDEKKKSQDQLQPGQPIFLALLVAFSLCLALL